ncbi:GHKL domain-containing protein [Caproiciproducens galactitolivorans]|nr:GHKL domain-containing protein [Caproiciproducens galactitolivorans]
MMNPNLLLTECFLSLAETIILNRLYAAFLTMKKQVTQTYNLLGLLSYFIFQFISYSLNCPLFSTAPFYLIFTFILAVVYFEENLQIKALTCFLFVILNYAGKLFAVYFILGKLENQTLPALPSDLVLGAETQIEACLFFLLFVAVILRFRKLRLENKIIPYTLFVFLAPTGVLYIVTRVFTHSLDGNSLPLYGDAAVLLICMALAVFYLLDKTVVLDETSERYAMFRKMLEMQEDYYTNLEASQREVIAIRHDIKNHMRCVSSMLKLGQCEEAQRYISSVYQDICDTKLPYQSGNVIIDIIIAQKLAKIEEMGVAPSVSVFLPPSLPIENVDLCILFGNLLDNAMEALERIDDPSVKKDLSIDARIKADCLFIRISNTYNGYVRKENDVYRSVKTGGGICGIGLSNVQKVAEKYHGTCSIQHDSRTFTVSVMLNLAQQES